MQLRYIGVDPGSGQQGSPTVWLDEANKRIAIQGMTTDPDLQAACAANPAPGHAPGIPQGEGVIWVPVSMVPVLREACDAAEQAKLL